MKIIIPLIGTFGKSGGFRVLSQLANHWINDNHEVIFLSYINAEDPYFPTDANILYYDNSGNIKVQKNKHNPKAMFGMFSLREALRKALNNLPVADVTEQIISQITKTKNNEEFIEKMDSYLKNYKN